MKYYKCREEDIGKSVLEVLAEAGELLPDTPCGGKGKCGKCRMQLAGSLSDMQEYERSLLGDDAEKGWRLACLTTVQGDFEYSVSCQADAKVQLDFYPEQNIATDGGAGTVLAVDIGTTTVAVYKCSRADGEIVDRVSFVNPQRVHGADVISRLVYAEDGGAEELKNEINASLKEAVDKLKGARADYCVVCGNTVMQHFLCGEDASGIAKLPFKPATLFSDLRSFDFCDKVYTAPCVAAYVGGDITLGALACSIDRVNELTLYIDIGTNGEIVLASPERILCCAAAAGPAFEGGNIDCGMMASEGAIRTVYSEDGEVVFATIADTKPEGICGSGLIDAVATFLELEIMDETGRLEEERYYFSDKIFISQKDIRALQSAKAAIAAGVRTLCHEMGCDVGDIERVIIAGGFGSHINAAKARRIGLIPYGCEAEMEYRGNCAGMGAVALAVNESLGDRLRELCNRMEYVELSGHKKFNEYYIDEMYFEE